MRCPACREPMVTFTRRLSGINSIRWTCPHCAAQLRSGRRVIAVLVHFAIAALGVAASGICLRLSGLLGQASGRRFVSTGLSLLGAAALPLGYPAFRIGAYRLS